MSHHWLFYCVRHTVALGHLWSCEGHVISVGPYSSFFALVKVYVSMCECNCATFLHFLHPQLNALGCSFSWNCKASSLEAQGLLAVEGGSLSNILWWMNPFTKGPIHLLGINNNTLVVAWTGSATDTPITLRNNSRNLGLRPVLIPGPWSTGIFFFVSPVILRALPIALGNCQRLALFLYT